MKGRQRGGTEEGESGETGVKVTRTKYNAVKPGSTEEREEEEIPSVSSLRHHRTVAVPPLCRETLICSGLSGSKHFLVGLKKNNKVEIEVIHR